jgi:lysophospholipase L1-like esterase
VSSSGVRQILADGLPQAVATLAYDLDEGFGIARSNTAFDMPEVDLYLAAWGAGELSRYDVRRFVEHATSRAGWLLPKRKPRVICIGDSITAGDLVELEEAWPVVFGEDTLDRFALDVEVLNRGVGGIRTDQVLASLDQIALDLTSPIFASQVATVGLGRNDVAQGFSLAHIVDNLSAICARCKHEGMRVVLHTIFPGTFPPIQIEVDANAWILNRAAEDGFADAVVNLRATDDGRGDLTSPDFHNVDGTHPNAAGMVVIAQRTADKVQRFIRRA